MSLSGDLRFLVERHCLTLGREVRLVSACLSALEAAGGQDPALLRETTERIHRLKGSSGTMGFAEICAAATALEGELRAFDSTSVQPDNATLADLSARCRGLESLIAAVRPEESPLYQWG